MKAFYENRQHRKKEDFFATKNQNMNFFAHWHKEIEMMYVLEGELGIGLNKNYRVLKKGELAISESNGIHYYNSQGLTSKTVMIIFMPERLKLKEIGLDGIRINSGFIDCPENDEHRKIIDSIIGDLVLEYSTQDAFYENFVTSKLNELFLYLFRFSDKYFSDCADYKKKNTDASLIPMQKALKFIEHNYAEEITLESLSDEVGLSPYYFSRLFKKTTGTNYNTYLSGVRINNAEHLIRTTGEHILDIAYKTGFKSIRTFNRTYKSLRGYTPQSLRIEINNR